MKWIAGGILVVALLASGCEPPRLASMPAPLRRAPKVAVPTGCQPHIELHSAATLAQEMGTTEAIALATVKINLWEKPTSAGKGRPVGQMHVGSRAVIIAQLGDDYRVQSPLDQSIGWVSGIQVARTLRQDTETFEPCD